MPLGPAGRAAKRGSVHFGEVGAALPPSLPRFLQSETPRFGVCTALPALSPLYVILFLKICFQICMEWQTVGGSVWGGRFAHERHTRTPHRTHAGPELASGGRGRRARCPQPPPGSSIPSRDKGGDPDLKGSPASARLCLFGPQAPGDFRWLEREFVLGILLALADRWAGEGLGTPSGGFPK